MSVWAKPGNKSTFVTMEASQVPKTKKGATGIMQNQDDAEFFFINEAGMPVCPPAASQICTRRTNSDKKIKSSSLPTL